jgi:hypothetical protein
MQGLSGRVAIVEWGHNARDLSPETESRLNEYDMTMTHKRKVLLQFLMELYMASRAATRCPTPVKFLKRLSIDDSDWMQKMPLGPPDFRLLQICGLPFNHREKKSIQSHLTL